jgi:flagellin
MVINTNLAAESTARILSDSAAKQSKSLMRLSSGKKIISPADNAVGLAVSIRFDAQAMRIGAARSNLGNSVSFNQTQDGYLAKVGTALDRMGSLATLSMDETKTDSDRSLYNQEFMKLGAYVSDLGKKEFNGISLFDGTAFNVTTDGDQNLISTTGVSLSLGTYTDAENATVDSIGNANDALTKVKGAIQQVTQDRSNIGSNISVLSSYMDQLALLKSNIQTSSSRIEDVDVAEESTALAKSGILVQSGTAMLSQANQVTQGVLKLLQV